MVPCQTGTWAPGKFTRGIVEIVESCILTSWAAVIPSIERLRFGIITRPNALD